MTVETFTDTGCPSGLAPPEAASAATDPTPFVREKNGRKTLSLLVRGAKCAGCLSKIEGAVNALPGVGNARLNLTTGRFVVDWTGGLYASSITQTIGGLGYGVSPYDPSAADDAAKKEERTLLASLGVAGFAMANIMLLSVGVWAGLGEMTETTRQWMHWLSAAIAIPAVAFSGQIFFRSAFAALKGGHANMDVPISLALILSIAVSIWETALGGEHAYFDAAVMLMFFLLIGRFLDARLRRRAHAAAHELAALQGSSATVLGADGVAKAVRAHDIMPGDLVLVAAGERATVDMEITEGSSEFDESLVTGESAPRQGSVGSKVFSGSVNLTRPITGRALAAAEDSLVADISRMLEAGEQRRSTYRRIADKAVSIYVPLVHTIAASTFIGWLIAGASVREAIYIAVSTLIITCPCALALAAPVVQVVASGRLFRRQVFLKSGDALERLATADHIVFDKTGTLTLGHPELTLDDASSVVLSEAAQLARASRHPLSRAIVEEAGPGALASEVIEHPGLGLEGMIDGIPARLGSAEWVSHDAGTHDGSSLWFVKGDAVPVPFKFADKLREDATETMAKLHARGLELEILSGDQEAAVAKIANEIDAVSIWTAGATPAEKVERLETLRAEGKKVLMVGDGLNDAGALAMAHASLAPGGAMDVSQSASDAVYSGGGLSAILTTLDIAQTARKRMLENFGLAALYNVIAVPIAVAGFVTPLIAAIAMSASSIIVTLNALRMNTPKRDAS